MRIVIVGGGLIGMMAAWELRQRGHEVTVLEKRPACPQPETPQELLGPASSWNGAGMLAPLGEVASDQEFFSWATRSRDLWPGIVEALEAATGIDVDFDRRGAILPVACSQTRVFANAVSALAGTCDEPSRWLSAQEVRDRLGTGPEGLEGGLLLEGDWKVDNRLVMHALYAAFEKLGGTVVYGARVVSVAPGAPAAVTAEHADTATRETTADRVVLAAGAWSAAIEGVPTLPVHPVRGQMIAWSDLDWWTWRGSVRRGPFYAVGREGGRLLVGATMEEAGYDDSPTDEGLEVLEAWAHETFPRLDGQAPNEHWAGLRPGTDGHPIVREVGESVMAATGHFRNGVLLAPWTAERVVTWVERS